MEDLVRSRGRQGLPAKDRGPEQLLPPRTQPHPPLSLGPPDSRTETVHVTVGAAQWPCVRQPKPATPASTGDGPLLTPEPSADCGL